MSTVQATVLTFDTAGSGTVVLDDGGALSFSAEAFAASGLRFLRPGQRVRVRLTSGGEVDALTIVTLPDPR